MYSIKAEGQEIVVKKGQRGMTWDQGETVKTFPIKDFESHNDTQGRIDAINWCKKQLGVTGHLEYLDFSAMLVL